jgi:UDP-N-acetylglucosamine 3-dehydrogenase
MTQPLHIVFLGCGKAADMHAARLRRMKGRDITLSFASRTAERAARACARFEGTHACDSYEAALSAPGIDAVFITTPTVAHAGLALAALEAGKDIIVEKPAFMTVAEAEGVAAAAAAADRQVLVAENYYYKPIARHLRAAVCRGDLGDVRFVHINATKSQPMTGWRAQPAVSGGGALFEGGVHWVSLASNIGLDVLRAELHRAGDPATAELSSLVVLRYANGAVGTLTHSWELSAPLRGLRLSKVQGTKGAVTFESNGLGHATTGARPSAGLLLRDPFGYSEMLRDFFRALRTREPAQFTLAMATRDLAIVAANGTHLMEPNGSAHWRTGQRANNVAG